MQENYTVCFCKQVTYADVANALEQSDSLGNALQAFEDVQEITHCSTGCGGCHQKILDLVSQLIAGATEK